MKDHLNDYVLEIHQELKKVAMILSDTISELLEIDDKTNRNLHILQNNLKKLINKDESPSLSAGTYEIDSKNGTITKVEDLNGKEG